MMRTFLESVYRLCRQVVGLLLAAGLLSTVLTVIAWAQGPDQGPQLWAQLLNSGIILLVGGGVVAMFFRFKDTATAKMQEDKEEQGKALQSAKDELAESQLATRRQIEQLTFAVLGIEGHGGGLMEDMATHQRRRHDLSNQMIRMGENLHELSELVIVICQHLEIPYDKRRIDWEQPREDRR